MAIDAGQEVQTGGDAPDIAYPDRPEIGVLREAHEELERVRALLVRHDALTEGEAPEHAIRNLIQMRDSAQRVLERVDGEWRALLKALEQCAYDLRGEIDNRYDPQMTGIHPALKPRYERDMTTVYEAEAAIAKARGG